MTKEAKIDYEVTFIEWIFVTKKKQDKELSPFHEQLLLFLKQTSEKQIDDLGIDPKSDLGAQNLFKSISEKMALPEIIENYHHFIEKGGQIQIEKALIDSFSLKEFIDLGLARYFPRVYRGLPRVFLKNLPTESKIQKEFTHLPSLKFQALSKTLMSLYAKVKLMGKVTLFTYVLSDGMGDFIAAVEALRLLKGRLHDLDLHFVALVPKSLLSFHFPENAIVVPYEKECPLDRIPLGALRLMRESKLILQLPTYYPEAEGLWKELKTIDSDLPLPKWESVGEYGFVESQWFHPKSQRYALGLHFLEKGILTRRPCLASWDDVQNETLKSWRREENRFYLAYLTSPIGGAIYLHALLKSLENDPRDIDICTPDLTWFALLLKKQKEAGKPLLEWDLGVSSLQVYYNGQIQEEEIGKTGKKVRLLCPGAVSQSDFRALLALSGEWVAVRGNQSFSEVVSQGKAFFYDGRDHARYFVKDLAAVAENRIGGFSGTLECIRGMVQGFCSHLPSQEGEEWVDETYFQDFEDWTVIALKLGLALQDPETIVGFKKLDRILVDEFSANGFLCHLVQRALCHYDHPYIEPLEKELVGQFIKNELKMKELIHKLAELIDGSIPANGR